MARIDAFLKLGMQQGCSDVHLAVGVPPMLRMHGDLLPIKFRDLRAVELEGYVTEILTRSQTEHFATGSDLDFLLCIHRWWPLPREYLPQGHRCGRHLPRHSHRSALTGQAGAAGDRHQAV
ncbi:MAG: hypothetical protein WDM77_13075 [Steroidobacteraceae bacterium]